DLGVAHVRKPVRGRGFGLQVEVRLDEAPAPREVFGAGCAPRGSTTPAGEPAFGGGTPHRHVRGQRGAVTAPVAGRWICGGKRKRNRDRAGSGVSGADGDAADGAGTEHGRGRGFEGGHGRLQGNGRCYLPSGPRVATQTSWSLRGLGRGCPAATERQTRVSGQTGGRLRGHDSASPDRTDHTTTTHATHRLVGRGPLVSPGRVSEQRRRRFGRRLTNAAVLDDEFAGQLLDLVGQDAAVAPLAGPVQLLETAQDERALVVAGGLPYLVGLGLDQVPIGADVLAVQVLELVVVEAEPVAGGERGGHLVRERVAERVARIAAGAADGDTHLRTELGKRAGGKQGHRS